MRTRTTWQGKDRETARQAATHRRADIYEMNFGGPRPQPTPDQYMAPDAGPDAWAETPASYDSVAKEYDSKGHVLRDEIGMAQMRENTFNRPAWGDAKKYDNRTASERKAVAAHRLATNLLKTSDQGLVRKVALGFMSMPDTAINTALQALSSASPKALPDDVRFKRALACTKLAASMLSDSASESSVERVARAIYDVDDLALRSIIKSVAMAKIAQQQEQQEEEEEEEEEQQGGGHDRKPAKMAQQQEQQEEEEEEEEQGGMVHSKSSKKPAMKASKKKPAHTAQQQEQQEEEEEEEEQQGGGHGRKPAKMAQQQQEQQEEEEEEQECGPVAQQQEEEEEEEEESLDSITKAMLQEMSGPAVPAEAAPLAPMSQPMPMAPMPQPMGQPMVASSLEALFSDDPEVRASRELRGMASGYDMNRVASTKGAKKLGSVRAASAPKAEVSLESLWDRT